jgi:MFS family permease
LSLIAEILEFFIQVPNLTVFFIVRFLQGTVAGLFLALIPVYVREISPKEINKRGIFGIFGQLFVILGFMMSFGLNTILLESGVGQILRWRLVVSLNFFVILIIIIGIVTKIIP